MDSGEYWLIRAAGGTVRTGAQLLFNIITNLTGGGRIINPHGPWTAQGDEQDVWAQLKATAQGQVGNFEQLRDGMGKTLSDPLLGLLEKQIALLKKVVDVSDRTPAIFRTKLTGLRGPSTPRRRSLD